MIIVDAHQDIAYNYACFKRDYRLPVYQQRRLEAMYRPRLWPGPATIGLPDALIGRVAIVFATIFVEPAESLYNDDPWQEPMYATPREAYELAMKQMDFYERMTDTDERMLLIRTKADLDAVLATWDEGTTAKDHRQGLVILMEGADPIREPKQFEEWYERGVRAVAPAWTTTRYAGGTGTPGPLTKLGHELLEVLASFRTILDLSHLAEESFFQALERYEGPLIASHSNPRRFHNTDRHLSDDMIRALAERDGVMGVVFYNRFLKHGWRYGDAKNACNIQTLCNVIDHVCQVTGSSEHVGIGTDLDGGFGSEAIPEGIDSVTDLYWLMHALGKRGYDPEDVARIAGGNMLRKLREAL